MTEKDLFNKSLGKRQENEQFESIVNTLINKNGVFETETKEIWNIIKKNEHFQSKYNSILNECESIKKNILESKEKQNDLMEVEKVHLSLKFEKLKTEFDESQEKIIELQNLVQTQFIAISNKDKKIEEDKIKIEVLATRLVVMSEYQERKQFKCDDAVNKVKNLEMSLKEKIEEIQEKEKEINEIRNECLALHSQIKEFEWEIDNKTNQIMDLTRTINNSTFYNQSNTDYNNNDLLLSLEGKIEILKRNVNRHQITWNSSFIVVKPNRIDIFSSEIDTSPIMSINLNSVIHIREPSNADVIHVENTVLPKILHIIYEEETSNTDYFQQSARRSSSFKSSDDLQYQRKSSNSTAQEISATERIYKIENHSFLPAKFRMYTSCDLCQLQCSDIFNPPMALECRTCNKRIHMEHVNNNDKRIQWCPGVIKDLFLKMNSIEEKNIWLNHLNQLKQHRKKSKI